MKYAIQVESDGKLDYLRDNVTRLITQFPSNAAAKRQLKKIQSAVLSPPNAKIVPLPNDRSPRPVDSEHE